jgi:hypothetical protein
MLIMFPVPGFIAKLVQDVQRNRLKRTDARVQTVTESESYLQVRSLEVLTDFRPSFECPTHDKTLRMGT